MFVDTVWGWSMRYDKTTSCHGISDKGSRRPQLPALTSALNVLAFMANSVSLKTWKLHVIAVNARASTDNPCHWPFLPLLGGCVRFKKRAMKRKKEKQKRKKKQIYQYRHFQSMLQTKNETMWKKGTSNMILKNSQKKRKKKLLIDNSINWEGST